MEDAQRWRLTPGSDLGKRLFGSGWSPPDIRTCRHSVEFNQAVITNGPGSWRFGQSPDPLFCLFMQRSIGAMSMDENVRIECDHGPSMAQGAFTLIINGLIDGSRIDFFRAIAYRGILQPK